MLKLEIEKLYLLKTLNPKPKVDLVVVFESLHVFIKNLNSSLKLTYSEIITKTPSDMFNFNFHFYKKINYNRYIYSS